MRLTRRTALGLLATSPALAAPALAEGRDWPNRRLRLVVPSAAGGYEVYARILAPRLAELLGQPVVVDNKPGDDSGACAVMLRAGEHPLQAHSRHAPRRRSIQYSTQGCD